eukprot:g5217.t1
MASQSASTSDIRGLGRSSLLRTGGGRGGLGMSMSRSFAELTGLATSAEKKQALAMKRNQSVERLHMLMRKSGSSQSLCSDCISRASSHASLEALATNDEEGDGDDDDEVCAAVREVPDVEQPSGLPGANEPGGEAPSPSDTSWVPDAAPADKLSKLVAGPGVVRGGGQEEEGGVSRANSCLASSSSSPSSTTCSRADCEVCRAESTSWRTLVLRALLGATGVGVTYLTWLRYLASEETQLSHVSAVIRWIGYLFQYRVEGLESIPKTGPAMIVCYHGFIPLDMYFFPELVMRVTGRRPMTCVADFVFKVPFLSWMVKVGNGIPANRKQTLEELRKGGLVIVAPGGVREAMTTTAEDYALRWYGKEGFADIARQTGATVVPMFTRNIREVFLVLGGGNKLVQRLYKLTKLPFTLPVWFGFVPLTTVLGKPIKPAPGQTTAQIATKVGDALQNLMSLNA